MRALNAMIGRNEQDAVRLMAHNEALTDQLEMIKRSAIERVKATSSYTQNGNSSEISNFFMPDATIGGDKIAMQKCNAQYKGLYNRKTGSVSSVNCIKFVINCLKCVPETLTNFVEESSHSLEADEFLSELSSFLSSEKVGLSEKIALKAALKKVEYPKDPELS